MKILLTITFTFALMFSTAPSAHSKQLLYLASTENKNIVAYQVDPKTGKLTPWFSVDLPGNTGPMAYSPDRSHIYAAMTGLKDDKAGVSTLKRSDDGRLKPLATATIKSRTAYIRTDVTGRYLLASHYSAGDVTTYRIVDGVCTDEMLDHKVTERTAHCIELDPTGEFVFVPHTAPNKVYQFRLDGNTGKLIPNGPRFVEGPDQDHSYHGPRHYAHHPKLDIGYTSNETGGGITAWKFNPEKGTLSRQQTLCTLPPDYDGQSAAADIRITPDGRFAYVTNRDTTKRSGQDEMQDTIAGVSLDPETGEMTLIGYFPTTYYPRSICIDLTGRFMYSAGQLSNKLIAYHIDQRTGELEQVATYPTGGSPMWVMCGKVQR